MNGLFLIIPVLLVRYGLLSFLGKEALSRAGFFPSLNKEEKIAFWVYQISNTFMFIYLLFLHIETGSLMFYLGGVVFCAGLVMYVLSTINFAMFDAKGLNRDGLYRISRNPMYVAYFIYFLGCGLLTNSLLLMIVLLVFQISSHWIILSEERWCIEQFGAEYRQYMDSVHRYL